MLKVNTAFAEALNSAPRTHAGQFTAVYSANSREPTTFLAPTGNCSHRAQRERKREREAEGRKREREGDRHRETKKSNIDHIFGIRSGPNDDGGGAGVLEVRKGRKKFFLGMLIEDTKIERPTR